MTVGAGPIAGGPFAEGDHTPRAITKAYWKKICPHPTLINATEVRLIHGEGASSLKITETWRDYIAKIDDPCLMVPRKAGNVYHVL